MNGSEQYLIVERLAQERNGTLLECPGAHVVIAIGCCEDDRNRAHRASKLALKVQAAPSRQLHVENQTFCILNVFRAQERFGRWEYRCLEARRSDQTTNGISDRLIVIHNSDQRRFRPQEGP